MRGMIWLVGCMVIGLGLEGGSPSSGARLAVWICAAGLWLFIGCGLAVMATVRLASGKIGAGLGEKIRAGSSTGPAPH